MTAEGDGWKSLWRESGLKYHGDVIRVRCGEDRYREVRVDESSPGELRIRSRVAGRRHFAFETAELGARIEAWRIDPYRELVGFKIADRGAIVGEAWIPLIDLSPTSGRCM